MGTLVDDLRKVADEGRHLDIKLDVLRIKLKEKLQLYVLDYIYNTASTVKETCPISKGSGNPAYTTENTSPADNVTSAEPVIVVAPLLVSSFIINPPLG